MGKTQKSSVQTQMRPLSRHEKEIGIQISQMEQYRTAERCDIGKEAYVEWVKKFSADIRDWLDQMSDDEVDIYFENLSSVVKQTMCRKCR